MSLSESKFRQVSRILLSILADLNNAVVWMVSNRYLISNSPSPFTNPLVTIIIIILITNISSSGRSCCCCSCSSIIAVIVNDVLGLIYRSTFRLAYRIKMMVSVRVASLWIDFNGMSTCLELSYAYRFGNHVLCTFIFTIFV